MSYDRIEPRPSTKAWVLHWLRGHRACLNPPFAMSIIYIAAGLALVFLLFALMKFEGESRTRGSYPVMVKELPDGIRRLVLTSDPSSDYLTSVEVVRDEGSKITVSEAESGVSEDVFKALRIEGDTAYWAYDPELSDYFLTISVPALVEVEVSGTIELYVELEAVEFAVRASGECEVTIAGDFDRLSLRAEGEAIVDAEDACAGTVSVHHDASNDMLVNASDRLDGAVLHDGDVYFHGQPVVDVKVAGRGGVTAVDSD